MMRFEFRVSGFEFRRPAQTGRGERSCLSTRNPKRETRNSGSAFTLLEILVVVAIIALVMTISVPFMKGYLDKHRGMGGAVRMVQEACSDARAMAILKQTPTELVIRPGDGSFDVTGASSGPAEAGTTASSGYAPIDAPLANRPAPAAGKIELKMKYPARLPEGVVIEVLGLSGDDWTEDPVARVRFYPNGTSDEMGLVLYEPETNERRKIWLDVITGLTDLESDQSKFADR
jgi:prepilin-type N-terminal cleavage/methylation domain-containing protein